MPTLSTAARNAAIDGVVALLTDNGAFLAGIVVNPSLGSSGVSWSGSTASGGSRSSQPNATVAATGSGTISSIDLIDPDLNPAITCTVTTTGGGGDIELNTLSVTSGDNIVFSAFTLAIAAS
jgi:hypothetical protein